ncbi:MAG: hypothetical protein ACLPVY_04090 [Acidimicrobiia bacterium]
MIATTTRLVPPERAAVPSCGLPPDQIHEWLERLQEDLRRVWARLEYLRAEQSRLENQQHLLGELLAASAAV